MREYVKPTLESIELRPEERLAHCGLVPLRRRVWFLFFWWYVTYGWAWKNNCGCS